MPRIMPDPLIRIGGLVGPGGGVVVQPAPLVQASESFTAADGTAITALSPPWTKHGSATNVADPTVQANRVVGEDTANLSLYYRNDWVPTSADYRVECDLVQRSDNNLDFVGVVGRLATGANTCYHARYSNATNVWQLFRVVAGAATQLGSDAGQVLTIDQAYRLALDMRGSQLTMSVDGLPLVAAIDANVTAPGRAGIRIIGNATAATGIHIDNWRAVQ
jgi:hypothetical protein